MEMDSGEGGSNEQRKRALNEDEDRSDLKVVKNRRLNKDKQPYVNTRCSPKAFLECVKGLPMEKRNVICSLGLGGLLELKVTKNNNAMVLELLKRFDKDTCSLNVHGKNLELTEDAVRRIMGFGSGQSEMKRLKSNLAQLQEKVHIAKKRRKDLMKGLDEIEDGTEWTANFILLAYNTILRPSSSLACSPSHLDFFNDIAKLQEVNWSKLVIEGVCEAAEDVVANLNHLEEGKRKSLYVKGCSLLLELFYVEHVDCGVVNTPWHRRRTPRLTEWTDDMVRKVYAHVEKRFDDDSVKLIMPSYDEDVANTRLLDGGPRDEVILEKLRLGEERMVMLENQVKAMLEKVEQLTTNAPNKEDGKNEDRAEKSRLDALEAKVAQLTEKVDLLVSKGLTATVQPAPYSGEQNVPQGVETLGENDVHDANIQVNSVDTSKQVAGKKALMDGSDEFSQMPKTVQVPSRGRGRIPPGAASLCKMDKASLAKLQLLGHSTAAAIGAQNVWLERETVTKKSPTVKKDRGKKVHAKTRTVGAGRLTRAAKAKKLSLV